MTAVSPEDVIRLRDDAQHTMDLWREKNTEERWRNAYQKQRDYSRVLAVEDIETAVELAKRIRELEARQPT